MTTVHPRPNRRVEINTAKMRARRLAVGDTYTALAARIAGLGIAITSARIGQIEHGVGSPSPELFPVLARALGMTEDELRRADAR